MGAQAMRDRVGNLPAELTTFVGRRREIDEVKARLASTRLLTLTGMGGVGKTRLARRIAADVNRAFPDGVWQVELADLGEPALVVQSIADCFGLLEEREQAPMTALKRHLADKR
jgi:predicted ATPase